MMRWLLTVLIPLHGVSAQPVTIQNESIPVEYYRLPATPLDASFATYSSDLVVPFSEFSKTNLSRTSLMDEYLVLHGYKEASGKGDVRIQVNVGDFTIWNEARKTETTRSKDKDGNAKTKTTYRLEVRYSMAMSYEVTDRSGKVLGDEYVSRHGDIKSWFSRSFSSLSDLDSYWRGQKASQLRTLQEDMIKNGLAQARDRINYQFGYPVIRENARFETIGKKKHPEYDKFAMQVEALKTALSHVRANSSLDEARVRSKSVLAFYADQVGRYKGGGKDEVRLRHICYYNLALAHFWLEEFEQAEKYTREILRDDPKDRDGKKLLEDISEVTQSLLRTGRTTRHQVRVGRA